MCSHKCHIMLCGGGETTCVSHLSPFTVQVPAIEFRLSGLAAKASPEPPG